MRVPGDACVGRPPPRAAQGRERAAPGLALALACAILAAAPAPAAATSFEPREFPDELTRTRYLDLIEELRCLVCQNQNLADSDAELAGDLREKVHELLAEGRSDAEIVDYMVQRYGDFVLYRPPVKAVTLGLWLGPGLMLVLALWLLIRHVRRRGIEPEAPPRAEDAGAEPR